MSVEREAERLATLMQGWNFFWRYFFLEDKCLDCGLLSSRMETLFSLIQWSHDGFMDNFEHWSYEPHPQERKAFELQFNIIPLGFVVGWQCASKGEQGGFLLWWISLPDVCKGCCDCHLSLGNKMGYRWAPYLMSVGIKCQFTMASNFSMTEWLIRWVLAVGYLRSPCGTCDNVIVLFWWTKDGVIINDDTTLGVFFMATTTLFFSLPQTA